MRELFLYTNNFSSTEKIFDSDFREIQHADHFPRCSNYPASGANNSARGSKKAGCSENYSGIDAKNSLSGSENSATDAMAVVRSANDSVIDALNSVC